VSRKPSAIVLTPVPARLESGMSESSESHPALGGMPDIPVRVPSPDREVSLSPDYQAGPNPNPKPLAPNPSPSAWLGRRQQACPERSRRGRPDRSPRADALVKLATSEMFAVAARLTSGFGGKILTHGRH